MPAGHNGRVTDRPIDVGPVGQADAVDVLAPGRVAVVTGAASGIGLALSQRLSAGGLRVVMADVDGPLVGRAAARLTASGRSVLAVATDVSKPEQVDALRDRAVAAFGAVHLVCNNAGVAFGGSTLWETAVADWEWVLGVNLWGVINGVRSFVPLLLEQDAGYIVNTASIAGLVPASGAYGVTKHAVVALSEALSVQLRARGDRVGVSVLCPGWVRTNIARSPSRPAGAASRAEGLRLAREMVRHGISARAVADAVVDAIRARRFYVLTHPELNYRIIGRAEAILAGDPPDMTGGA